MAGTFTHFIACDQAKSRREALGDGLWQLLNRHSRFLFLGAVSPDLPYLSVRTGSVNWADVMHYEKTDSPFRSGYARLQPVWSSKTPADDVKLVWLMGFVSHLVVDATIHPVVQAVVGPYSENAVAHRLCEMTEDSMIYSLYRNGDIRYAQFSDMLAYCRESEHFDGLMDFWKGLLIDSYPDKDEEPHPSLWFATYGDAIGLAEGGSGVAALFRHMGLGASLVYKTRSEIENSYPDDLAGYFTHVSLPAGGSADFDRAVFEKALGNVTVAWNAVYTGLTEGRAVPGLIRNWNLDTGVDMDSPDGIVTYWT